MSKFDFRRRQVGPPDEPKERLLSLLGNLGLTDYESKAYIALISLEDGTADSISKASTVPRTSIYKAMASLEDKDLVVSHPGKPRRYRPVDLDAVERQVIFDIKEGFEELRSLRGSLSDIGSPQLVYTIFGQDRVLAKIGELIDESVSSIYLSSPDMRVLRAEHGERLSQALKRGVNVALVMEPFVKSPDCSEVHRREGLMITDLVVDNEYSLLATPGFDICGFIEDPFISQHLEHILRSSIRM